MNSEVAGSSPASRAKLYGVGRADLAPGLRAAQMGHVLIKWTLEYGRPPENLVLLEVQDEVDLEVLAEALGEQSEFVGFREPDLRDQLTALAVHSDQAGKLLSQLPLAYRD